MEDGVEGREGAIENETKYGFDITQSSFLFISLLLVTGVQQQHHHDGHEYEMNNGTLSMHSIDLSRQKPMLRMDKILTAGSLT